MSSKIIKAGGGSKPIRMWIDGKCFNLKQFRSSKKGSNNSSNVGLEDKELQNITDTEEHGDSEFNFDVDDKGKISISVELPPLYYIRTKQFYSFDLNSIRSKTNTTITLPNAREIGKLIISGENEMNIKQALDEIHSLMGQIRNREIPLQFIAIPLLSDEIKDNFGIFKNEVLKETDTRGLEESIFQSPLKLHLTIDVFVLLSDREIAEATQALNEWNKNILKPLIEKSEPLKIHVAGIECMNEDYKKVDVLYAKAKIINETEDVNLQKISNSLSAFFYERGLLKKHTENVKLHMTLINTKYRKDTNNSPKKRWTKRISFDATKIIEKYRDFEFGCCDLNTIHISKMQNAVGEDGFYQNLTSIAV